MMSFEGKCEATWKREFKLPWREGGPPNRCDDKVDSDHQVFKKTPSVFSHQTLIPDREVLAGIFI